MSVSTRRGCVLVGGLARVLLFPTSTAKHFAMSRAGTDPENKGINQSIAHPKRKSPRIF